MPQYTETEIPVQRLVGQHERCRWEPQPTRVLLHPSGRFAIFQHNPHQDADAAVVHVPSGVQLTCRAVGRARAKGWIDHLLTVESDNPDALAALLAAHITAERAQP